MSYSDYRDLKIGADAASMQPVVDLQYNGQNANVPPPKTKYKAAVRYITLADGNVKRLGLPVITWSWPRGMPNTARKALMSFLDGQQSNVVYITSPDDNGDIQTYRCVMTWHTEALGYMSFEHTEAVRVVFTRCEKQ